MTFTFTIDCFPAYTKFNKTKKVLATLQVLDADDYKHNYSDKTIIGHVNRTDDKGWEDGYGNSIWNDVDAANTIDVMKGHVQEVVDLVKALSASPTQTEITKVLRAYAALTDKEEAMFLADEAMTENDNALLKKIGLIDTENNNGGDNG